MVPPDDGFGRVGRPNKLYKEKDMTALDIIAAHLDLSVDEVRAVLEAANSAAYSMEMDMQRWFDSYMDMELSELGIYAGDVKAAVKAQ
jgi:hypothetical protein